MGCKQFRIKPDDPVDKNEEEKSISTAPQVETVQILSRESNKTKSGTVVVYRNPLSLTKSLVVTSVISNGPDEFSQHLPPIISRTPIKTNKSDEYHHTTNSETLSQSGKPIPLKNMDSDMSDISEHSIITLESSESDESDCVYRPTTSSTVGKENMAHRKDAMNRFMSGRPQRVNTCQESTRNNIGSESDERYSICHSIASSVSADSEGSVVNQPKGAKNVYFHPKQSNLQQKPFTHGSTSESDASGLHDEPGGNSALREVQVMKEHLETVLRSKSTKLSSPDFHHRGIHSATTSEAEQF